MVNYTFDAEIRTYELKFMITEKTGYDVTIECQVRNTTDDESYFGFAYSTGINNNEISLTIPIIEEGTLQYDYEDINIVPLSEQVNYRFVIEFYCESELRFYFYNDDTDEEIYSRIITIDILPEVDEIYFEHAERQIEVDGSILDCTGNVISRFGNVVTSSSEESSNVSSGVPPTSEETSSSSSSKVSSSERESRDVSSSNSYPVWFIIAISILSVFIVTLSGVLGYMLYQRFKKDPAPVFL